MSDQDNDNLVGADHPRVRELLNAPSVAAVHRRVRECGVPHVPMGRGKGRIQFYIPALKAWLYAEAMRNCTATAARNVEAQ